MVLAARAGVKLVETTVKPMDQNLVKITGAIQPSGVPIVVAESGKSEKSGRPGRSRGGYGDSRSRGGGKKKKSRPRPNERRKRPR